MFYQAESAHYMSITIDEALNWVYFVGDTLAGNDFYPPISRERTALRSASDWKSWREQVWDICAVEASGSRASGSSAPGMDPEEFTSMQEWTRLRVRCRDAWPEFLVWWRKAKPMLTAEINSPAIREIVSDAHRPTLRLHVVALRDAQDMASRDDHHLISVGLLKDHDRFRNWLGHQA